MMHYMFIKMISGEYFTDAQMINNPNIGGNMMIRANHALYEIPYHNVLYMKIRNDEDEKEE